jgi:hypothetical protein
VPVPKRPGETSPEQATKISMYTQATQAKESRMAWSAAFSTRFLFGKRPDGPTYDPGRKMPMAVGNFLRENLTVKNFTEYLAWANSNHSMN